MSIINSPRKSRLRVARIALIPAVAVGLIGGPVAAAGPATASTSERGCTVDPLKPVKHDHKDSNKVRVDFRIYVDCNGNKKVEIRQLRFEDDRGRNDDFLGKSTFWESFDRRDDAVTIHSYDRVPNLDRRGSEEVYQLVSFRVQSGNSDQLVRLDPLGKERRGQDPPLIIQRPARPRTGSQGACPLAPFRMRAVLVYACRHSPARPCDRGVDTALEQGSATAAVTWWMISVRSGTLLRSSPLV